MADPVGRILAVDPGEVRIGLALSDVLGISVHPLELLKSMGPKRDVDAIGRIAEEQGVVRVLVGLPLLLSGEEGQGVAVARRFAARLRSRLGEVDVQLWDERLTTVQAERMLIGAGVKPRRRREVVDGLAAVLILKSYLDSRPSSEDLQT
jgi:putative Holliday junction resolvase